MKHVFFTSPEHKERFLDIMEQLGKIDHDGKITDYGHAAAFYILTSKEGTWNKVKGYVTRHGIKIQTLLEEVDFSHGYVGIIELASNLFNSAQKIDVLDLQTLDEKNYRVALTAMLIRKYGLSKWDVLDEEKFQGEVRISIVGQDIDSLLTELQPIIGETKWSASHFLRSTGFDQLDITTLQCINVDHETCKQLEQWCYRATNTNRINSFHLGKTVRTFGYLPPISNELIITREDELL